VVVGAGLRRHSEKWSIAIFRKSKGTDGANIDRMILSGQSAELRSGRKQEEKTIEKKNQGKSSCLGKEGKGKKISLLKLLQVRNDVCRACIAAVGRNTQPAGGNGEIRAEVRENLKQMKKIEIKTTED